MELEDLKGKYEAIQDTIYFDEVNYYREQTKDPEVVQKLTTNLEEKLYEGGEDPYFLLGTLGYCYRGYQSGGKGYRGFPTVSGSCR